MTDPLSFWHRLRLAVRVLFDPVLAARAAEPTPAALPPPDEPDPGLAPRGQETLQLLALLQREGRLVDFLEQDITSFADGDVGAAARVVHDGCRRALHAHLTVLPVRTESEGTSVTLEEVDPTEVKLTGNVGGAPPYRGVLRHRGWRAENLHLPEVVAGHEAAVLARAEVEL